jgi:hypothetical protein
MKNTSREDKLFKKEVGIFNHYKELQDKEQTPEQLRAALEDLTSKYKSLLDQTRFLTWISGRLERKLHRSNRSLNERNIVLEKTLTELVNATAGRNAYIIMYVIAIFLFVLEEFFVEPIISMFGNGVGLSILIKLIIVLLLKVSEGFIEERVRKKPKLQGIRSSGDTGYLSKA